MREIATRGETLLKFYDMCRYKGVYYFKNDDGKIIQIERNTFGTASQRAAGIKPKSPFRLGQALQQHCDGVINFAMRFKGDDLKGRIIAFDLDADDDPKGVLASVRDFEDIIQSYGIDPFIYHSGGKGYHVEIRTVEPMPQKELSAISKWFADVARAKGVRYIDRIYPYHKPAYRIFGSQKLNNGNFTRVLTDGGLLARPDDCWQVFQQHMENHSASIDLINKLYIKAKPVSNLFEFKSKKEQKERHLTATNSKSVKKVLKEPSNLNVKVIELLYTKGLQEASTRHRVSFHLGRYFRYYLMFSREEAVEEIKVWIQKHFDGTFKQLISVSQEEALKDSIDGVRNAYTKKGFPLKFRVEVKEEKALLHAESLGIKKKVMPLVSYLLSLSKEYKSLVFFQSRQQFMNEIGLSDRGIKNQLNKLQELGFLKKLKEGNNITHVTTKWKLEVPEECYKIIEKKIETTAETMDETVEVL